MLNIAVLVSGGGTNLQALIDAQNSGKINNGQIVRVIADRPGVFALERAKNAGIESVVVDRKAISNTVEHNKAVLSELENCKADLIVLAGYLSILTKEVTDSYENKIINVHPSLIPSFCGDGFYGLRVHKAALEKGVKITGATVHFVNEVTDGGAIILQKAVAVENGDTPEVLQKRVMEQAEWEILPLAVSLFCEGKIKVIDNKTQIM